MLDKLRSSRLLQRLTPQPAAVEDTNNAPVGTGPYKGRYTTKEFWDEFTASSLWRTYKKNNPKEAATVDAMFQHKINGDSYMMPIGITKTHVGNALLMAQITLPAQ